MSTIGTTSTKTAAISPLVTGVKDTKPRSLWSDALRRLLKNKAAVLGLTFIILEIIVAIAAPVFAPADLDQRFPGDTTSPPSRAHIFGTDTQGRDVLSRLIYGSRVSLAVGFIAEAVILCIGVPLGLVAGYYGKWADTLLMRFVDVMYAFPDLLLMITLVTYLKAKLPTVQSGWLLPVKQLYNTSHGMAGILIALALTSWLTLSRLVRGEVLALKRREFIEAAHAIGATNGRIMRQHLLPNILAPIIVSATIGVPAAILAEAGLSFLGLGVQQPIPSWGMMISEGLGTLRAGKPHITLPPAIVLSLTVLAFNFFGDGLRDALDPRMKS